MWAGYLTYTIIGKALTSHDLLSGTAFICSFTLAHESFLKSPHFFRDACSSWLPLQFIASGKHVEFGVVQLTGFCRSHLIGHAGGLPESCIGLSHHFNEITLVTTRSRPK